MPLVSLTFRILHRRAAGWLTALVFVAVGSAREPGEPTRPLTNGNSSAEHATEYPPEIAASRGTVIVLGKANLGDGAQTRVARWDRVEIAVKNDRAYVDPMRDVSLDVVWTRPDGTDVEFWGFYDDDQTWRARFMPDQVGAWNYVATFSDGSSTQRGEFQCVEAGRPGMIAVHAANPIWFGRKGGEAVLLRSLHVGDRFFARNWDPAMRSAFLDWAQAQGYNTLSIASHYLNRDEPDRGQGWQTPALWPLRPEAWRELEVTLNDLARREIVVFPFAGFFGRASNFPHEPAEQERYIRYALARLGPYRNLLLNVAGPEPNLRRAPYLSTEEVTRLGRLIRRLDVFGHPLTVHNRTGIDPYRDSDWSSFGTLQGPKTIDRAEISRELLANHHPAKPLYAQETLWPGNIFGHPAYSDDDIRRNAFVILFSATMLNFGDMQGSSSSGFSNSMDPADAVPTRHALVQAAWDLFASLPFGRMSPQPGLVTAGYCLAEGGRDYAVFLSEGLSVDVQIEPGIYQVEWIDTRHRERRIRGGTTSYGSGLTPPDPSDWILRLVRE